MSLPDNAGTAFILGTGGDAGADEDDFHTFKRTKTALDAEEQEEKKAIKNADVKMGAMSRTIKSFSNKPPNPIKKKVVVF